MSTTPAVQVPDAAAATDAALRLLGSRAVSVARFTTGNCHWVFDVRLETGASVVLRMATASLRPAMCGAGRLNGLLRPMGVPLPRVLCADLDATFPTLVLERLAGTDLRHFMSNLIGIGGRLTAPPLPHHRAYGSRTAAVRPG